ncbi:PEP-CTERM sorting domain-containing protein [Massilia sp. BSC265]|uniref:PEP-CTERM sorting domain-containing protein n=1 Tax=Massilia sp. BSC265 TaxID=1549812 RepID=UPI0004E94055|nr:PEP-CTERM sorting domain-containing protein [Massilia sp. BSC265]KFI07065.1 hypothetical protein JN27_10925 [Massilia sp. BSC265]
MKLSKLFGFVAALSLSCAAKAVVLTDSTGSNTVTDYSETGKLSFDLGLQNLNPTTMHFALEAGDLQGPLNFSALVLNFTGLDVHRFTFSLQGIRFAATGSVTPVFTTVRALTASDTAAVIDFSTPLHTEFQFGDALGYAGQTDWLLDTSGLQAGDSFSITATVPEPSSAALVLPMLCMGLLAAARRRKKD